MPSDLSQYETCRIAKNEFMDGCLKLREYSFLEDHSICLRITVLDTDDQPVESTGWLQTPFKWPDLLVLRQKINEKAMSGWAVVWGGKCEVDMTTAEDLMKIVRW